MLLKYDQWFDEAEEAVKGKPELIARVNGARISTDYTILEAARINDPRAYSLVSVGADGSKQIDETLKKRLDRFKNTCDANGIINMNEIVCSSNFFNDICLEILFMECC